MVREIADRLWVAERPLRFLGLEVGSRMTIARLDDGSLWLHSPVALDDDLRRQVEDLGIPRYAVAPNRFHHMALTDWAAARSTMGSNAAEPTGRTSRVVMENSCPM